MRIDLLLNLMEKHNIPKNVTIQSDSGWECCETDMDGIYYNRRSNTLIFTQSGTVYDKWFHSPDWELIYGNNKLCQHCEHLKNGECIVKKDAHGYELTVATEVVKHCDLRKKRSI